MPLMQHFRFGNDRTELPDFNQRCQMQGLEPCCTSKLLGRYDFFLLYKNHPIKSPFSHHWMANQKAKIWWWYFFCPGCTSQSHYVQWLYGCLPKDGRMASSTSTSGGRGGLQCRFAAVFFQNTAQWLQSSNDIHSKCWGIWIAPLIYNKTTSSEHLDLPGFYSWLHHLQFYHRCMSSLGWVDDSFIPSGWDASAEVSELAELCPTKSLSQIFEAWRLWGF